MTYNNCTASISFLNWVNSSISATAWMISASAHVPSIHILFRYLSHEFSVLLSINLSGLSLINWTPAVRICIWWLLLMVFTVTSSDCKVKKARFYEFLFTLGWRLIGNKSLYKFPAPQVCFISKFSSLNFRVFTVRDTKIGMLSLWKKSLRLIFSSLTISRIRRYVYAQVC